MMAADPLISIVIFGASGDLTGRKLIPAFYNLYLRGIMPPKFKIVGVSRTVYSHDEFRQHVQEALLEFHEDQFKADSWQQFEQHLFYIPEDAADSEKMEGLDAALKAIEGEACHRLYYLAVAPTLYEIIIENLGSAGLAKHPGALWRRVIIEKPFGVDLASAQALNAAVHRVFDEDQVYRIDHYLGKETAQNILFFRFANTIFEPVWNHNYINNVQITVAETVDVGQRGAYYDQAGILRDMFQNHILQLLTLVAMEPPANLNATALRNEKVKLIQSIHPLMSQNVVTGQYDGYRKVKGVATQSNTPTYAAIKMMIDNWRWKDVPFYLRSGKALAKKTSQIVVEFRSVPHLMFNLGEGNRIARNILSLCIQPDEGIHLQFEAKIPGSSSFQTEQMEFHYSDSFDSPNPDAYQRLLLDAIQGDASLFTRSDEIEAAWHLYDPLIALVEKADGIRPQLYRPGSWGPESAYALLAKDQRVWHKEACLHEEL